MGRSHQHRGLALPFRQYDRRPRLARRPARTPGRNQRRRVRAKPRRHPPGRRTFRGQSPKIAGINYAIVAGNAAYEYALAFQEASGPTGLVAVVFSDLDIACNWLGLSVEDVEPTIEALRVEIRSR